MEHFFVGKKANPRYLVETIPKKKEIKIYKPDKYSDHLDHYERYALGKNILTINYENILFTKQPVDNNEHRYIPEIIIKTKNTYIWVSKHIKTFNKNKNRK
jgi:hypothetical protein